MNVVSLIFVHPFGCAVLRAVFLPHSTNSLFLSVTSAEPPKTPVVMRKIIVRNPDGTTKLIQKKVLATGSSGQMPSGEAPRSTPQKVQVIRRPDGTLQYQGLKPGQQLIRMPDGKLHILTTRSSQNSANTSTSGIVQSVQKTGTPKVLAKAVAAASPSTPNASQTPAKAAVVVRQQTNKPAQANLIVKAVAQKPTVQRVRQVLFSTLLSLSII